MTTEPDGRFNAGVFILRVDALMLTMLLDAVSAHAGPLRDDGGTPEQSALDNAMNQVQYRDHVIFQVRRCLVYICFIGYRFVHHLQFVRYAEDKQPYLRCGVSFHLTPLSHSSHKDEVITNALSL